MRETDWLVDPETGAEHQLTDLARGFVIRDFDVSADGREIVFDRVQEHSDLARSSADCEILALLAADRRRFAVKRPRSRRLEYTPCSFCLATKDPRTFTAMSRCRRVRS